MADAPVDPRWPQVVEAGGVSNRTGDGRLLLLDRHLINGTLAKVAGLLDSAGVPFDRMVRVEYGDGPGATIWYLREGEAGTGEVWRTVAQLGGVS